jgi:hypothetical protein
MLVTNPSITIHDIMHHRDKLQLCEQMSAHISWKPDITINVIRAHIEDSDIKWNKGSFISNGSITLDELLKHAEQLKLDRRTIFTYYSKNRNVSIKDVKKHRNAPWNWRDLSNNSSITFKDVMETPEFPWETLILMKDYRPYFEEKARVIQRLFLWHYYQPASALCRKRLEREFQGFCVLCNS